MTIPTSIDHHRALLGEPVGECSRAIAGVASALPASSTLGPPVWIIQLWNLSSASVLLVLEDVTIAHRPAPGTLGVILAMGPEFCSEMILVRW
ncbi:MAG TPA: hypothetical protein VNE82_17670 [Candidatus Binataceae bacterium]|nr:hypothetical protein [Candidatus Binataceae bacterium]